MRRRTFNILAAAAVAITAALAGAVPASATPVVRSLGSTGALPPIGSVADQFRTDLGGGDTAGADGNFGNLRREIGWDGVPAEFNSPNPFKVDFFNTTSPRGLVVAGSPSFEVSNFDPNPALRRFGTINPTYPTAFGTFSAPKLFASIGSTSYDVNFFVPGTTTPATVKGFGAVFTDVDQNGSSKIDYFGVDGKLITSVPVPAGTVGDASLSFVGTSFTTERVALVRVTQGSSALSSTNNDITQGGTGDVVAADDFIYGEPVALKPTAFAFSGLDKKLKLKKGKKKTLAVKITNSGEISATPQICVTLPKKARKVVKVKGGQCRASASVAPGATVETPVKISAKKAGSYSATVKVTGSGFTEISQKVKLKVK